MSDLRQREHYRHFTPITTRWHDNDVYGHVNNVVYYSFFDSAVNRLLVREGGLDIDQGRVIALVVSSACDYQAPVAFPHDIEVGLVVDRLGNTSVHYQLAVFLAGQPLACATGRFVHVFVDREGRRPVPVPDCLRRVLSELQPLSPEEQPS
ncbi:MULTISPECIES: acyl-CoA thioesterase [Pseudomonas]|uniref:acyl-CoA thioesterase n=1 Tax=Pseudomonas TaxID=286 RepID=UPI000C2A8A86|nr:MULTISPECIES: thioesterase family protein [Pseudomonas]PJX11387.1 thioesterase [Pseudomonas putida]QNG08484.1 acyl-CoA thioesterase [Pseudomonas putida]UFH25591.1 acyl-CoA thioesterase [Pseudomonas sp. CIP-10]HDS1060345.1 acyl-CoA thioesterase [Pseudomonas putida]